MGIAISRGYRPGSVTLGLALPRIAFLSDRSVAEALPALDSMGFDVKTEPLSPDSLGHLPDLAPSLIVVDAVGDPELAHGLLGVLSTARIAAPVVVLARREDVERRSWAQVADELVLEGDRGPETRVRFGMLLRRLGGPGEAVLRLGALAIDVESYQVSVAGRVLDLTYKEFELLRFLVERAGRVHTRVDLLAQVWGYNFYGGTRTVDVHVRRLRAKLGTEHEALIQTVRGVGYRAAEPRPRERGTD